MVLVAYAAAFHVRFRDASYWWLCLVLLVVLSGGTAWTIVGYEIPLPGVWLRKTLPLVSDDPVPDAVQPLCRGCRGAGGGERPEAPAGAPARAWMRGVVLAALTVGAVADLAMVPYFQSTIPKMPGCYAFMQRTAPGAAFVEVPQFGSGGSDLYSICRLLAVAPSRPDQRRLLRPEQRHLRQSRDP